MKYPIAQRMKGLAQLKLIENFFIKKNAIDKVSCCYKEDSSSLKLKR